MNIKLISEREVLQPVERKDICIRKVQVIEVDSKRFEVPFWYDSNLHLHHVGAPECLNQ